jgi:hypothetical protein
LYDGRSPRAAVTALPTHTATTSGAPVAPSDVSLLTSFGLPRLPMAATDSATLPLNALSTSSDPGSRTNPLSPLATPITSASTLRVVGLLVLSVTVAKAVRPS